MTQPDQYVSQPGKPGQMIQSGESIHGRGTAENPRPRFLPLTVLRDPDAEVDPADDVAPATQFFRDASRTVIARNDSPDVGFEFSLNPYRGCEHGCIYCYARPTHEYLDMSAGLDFETKIMVKEDAPRLLRAALSKKSWQPRTVSIGGVTDPYQPVERRLKLTRRCLEVFLEFRNPATVISKNHLVTRDIDVLSAMARERLTAVFISVTTLEKDVTRILEPRTSVPNRRLDAIRQLTDAGIPVGVMVAPVVPGLTDHEMPAILQAAKDAGAITAGYVPLRLPFAVKDLFEAWLARHMPDRKEKILNRIRSMRNGKLNDSNFGTRMRGHGIFADQMHAMFEMACKRAGLQDVTIEFDTSNFRRAGGTQLSLFQ
jgi:DNA repair photolyase